MRKKKRLISLLLAVFIAVACLPAGIARADKASSIELKFDRNKGEVGDILIGTVRINNIKNFAGFQVNIVYDPKVLMAVDPETGKEFTSSTFPPGRTVLKNNAYGPIQIADNDPEKGILNFALAYSYIAGYKETGVTEESGIIAKIGFKILQKKSTAVKFQDTLSMPGAILGTQLFDWDGEVITGYEVIQPDVLSLGDEPYETPGTDIPISDNPAATPSSTPSVTPSPEVKPTQTPSPAENSAKVELEPVLDNATGEAKAAIDEEKLNKALDEAKKSEDDKLVELNIKKVENADAYIQQLPAKFLIKSDAEYKLRIATEQGIIEVPANMLNTADISKLVKNDSVVEFVIRKVKVDELGAELKEKIGNRPVIDISVVVDGKKVEWSNYKANVKISIPYKPDAKELENHEHIVVLHIDDAGKAVSVPSGKYEPSLGVVTFETNHLSKYAVSYVYKTFADIGSYAWAKKQIEVLASKGVINGTSDTTFTPQADITRADFMILLVKALGLTAEVTSNFDDVSEKDYYYEYVGIAKELGITTGVGNNKFNPKAKITRQDMMVLTTNALRIAGKISSTGTRADVERFSDKDQIASYAVEGVATLVKEGIVVGSGDIINPRGNASRAELAAIIYKIYYK
ncbi:S-layer homology domain-containing protein [Acetivibrio thermocellus]|uniref:S-layer homology domain-containing protein n=1 Tax=Acetivibrio thermocellus TaxID=1515 RepID=UPI0021ADCDDD|nr:S-layer homology domain-containing protein [Acetivibrio thermocellus]UWV47856.1 S-layer homology domain-containing protein [Acetivibrio thermocellus]